MKKLEALIRPFELDEVKDRLSQVGINKITVTDVRASSGGKEDDPELYLGENYAGYVIEFLPKVKIEVIVDADKVAAAAEAILKTSREGEKRGQVFVYNIEKTISH